MKVNRIEKIDFEKVKEENTGKINSVSLIRFISVLLIITCHIFQYNNSNIAYWLNCGVQIFLVMSGFLYGMKTIEKPLDWFWHNLKKIYFPYIIYVIIAIIVYYVGAPEYINIISIVKLVTCLGTVKGLGHLWFVGYIIFCYLITYLLQIIREEIREMKINKFICTVLIIMCLFEVLGVVSNSYIQSDKIICYILGYFCATLFSKYGLIFLNKLLYCLVPFTICICSVRIYFEYFASIKIRAMGHFVNLVQMCLALTIFFLLFVMFKRMKFYNIFNISDKYSYYVYLVHHIFILGPFSLLALWNTRVKYIVLFLAIVASTVFLYQICQGIEFVWRKVYEKSNVGIRDKA